jgi:hypothetical protein
MGDAPSPYALMLARVFASAAAELGKDCTISYESPSVPLRVVPESEYAVPSGVPAVVLVPEGCRPYNLKVCVCLFIVIVFVYLFVFVCLLVM